MHAVDRAAAQAELDALAPDAPMRLIVEDRIRRSEEHVAAETSHLRVALQHRRA